MRGERSRCSIRRRAARRGSRRRRRGCRACAGKVLGIRVDHTWQSLRPLRRCASPHWRASALGVSARRLLRSRHPHRNHRGGAPQGGRLRARPSTPRSSASALEGRARRGVSTTRSRCCGPASRRVAVVTEVFANLALTAARARGIGPLPLLVLPHPLEGRAAGGDRSNRRGAVRGGARAPGGTSRLRAGDAHRREPMRGTPDIGRRRGRGRRGGVLRARRDAGLGGRPAADSADRGAGAGDARNRRGVCPMRWWASSSRAAEKRRPRRWRSTRSWPAAGRNAFRSWRRRCGRCATRASTCTPSTPRPAAPRRR